MLISSFLPSTGDRVLNKGTKGSGRQAVFSEAGHHVLIIAKATKSKSKKEFQHTVKNWFFPATVDSSPCRTVGGDSGVISMQSLAHSECLA